MDNATLITKVLLPRRRDDVLTRQRLLNRLYDMVDYKLALVSAPAGYGKSTLLVDFAADLEHPVCWYALDATDGDPRVFLERLVLSLQRRFSGFGEATLRSLAATQDLGGGAPGVVRILVNEIVNTIPRWFVLVLDDYHTLGQALDVDAILSNFVAYQRDQCLTILSSRTVPNLPLIIPLVARGGVGGIGLDEMRFIAEEIQALYLHNYDRELSKSEAEELAAQSEGWITGLLLTAYSHFQGVMQSWIRARSSRQPVYDYLAQEVYSRQTPAMQEFLSVSATLTEMNATLCRQVLGISRAQAFLDEVEARNLFVSRLEGGGLEGGGLEGGGLEGGGPFGRERTAPRGSWYRYHHLFSEYLQSRMRRDDPARWSSLHLRAAGWFEARGQRREAIHHYLAVEALAEASKLMQASARDLTVGGQFTTLMTWRERLPERILRTVPRLALYQARAAYRLARYDQAHELTRVAESGYREVGDLEGLAYARLFRADLWLVERRARAARDLALEVLASAEDHGLPIDHEVHRILGRAYVLLGELDAGYDHLREALAYSEARDDDHARALARTGLAHCLEMRGELQEAVRLHREAVDIWRLFGSEAGLVDELNDLGFHLSILGEFDEAMRCFHEALTLCRQTGLRRTEAYALVSVSEMSRDLGLLEQAADYGSLGLDLAEQIGDRFLVGYGLENLGLVRRAEKAWPDAVRTIEAALAEAELQGTGAQHARYLATLGIVKAEMGDLAHALETLDEAVATLSHLGVGMELVRAQLLRAEARYLANEPDRAVAALGALLSAPRTPAERHVLVVEGQHAMPLLRAARKTFGDTDTAKETALKSVLSGIRALHRTARRLFPQVASAPEETPSEIRVYGFGPGRVEVGGEPVPAAAWGSAAARQLLFYTLTRQACTREEIAADFWPENTPQKAKAAFHTTKFRLSRALGQDVIDYNGRVYLLHPDVNVWYDVDQFRACLSRWRETRDVEALDQAVGLYVGDFLTDVYQSWCDGEREALRVACLEAAEALAERLLARRQYRRAVQALRRALELEPARETFHRQLMRAYALSGERSRALAQYDQCREALRDELDAQPSHETRDLRERIRIEAPLD